MKLFFILFFMLLILFIPIPIKLIIYYSSEDYYIKIYKFTLISKKRPPQRDKPVVKKERKFFSRMYEDIDYKTLISNIYSLNLKFKPIFKFNLYLNYSLSDAARTALFYGLLCQVPPLIYNFLRNFLNIKKYNLKINPVFEDKFLLKIESYSIIFLSFANIIFIIFILFKKVLHKGR